MDKIRAFIAVELFDKLTLDNIEKYQRELQKSMGPLKLVERDLMHVTLRFLGDISENNAKIIYKFLEEEVNPKYFNSSSLPVGRIQGVGDFNKNIFFVKIEDVTEILKGSAIFIENWLQKIPEIRQEDKKFTPHLTIARGKRDYHNQKNSRLPKNAGQKPYPQLKSEYQDFAFGEWHISKAVLKKSVLTPKGPIYTNLKF